MAKTNPNEKKLSIDSLNMAQDDPLKLLADFFKGVVIKIDEEYSYES